VRESFLHLYFLLERIYSLLELRKDFRMKYEFKTQPYQHQKDALVASWNKREYALFMEMGTGKSKVLIDNMAILYGKGGCHYCAERRVQKLVGTRNPYPPTRSYRT